MATLGNLLPFRDPWRRGAARQAARTLVDWVPSPDADPLPEEIAQLALLRLLWLQRLIHGSFQNAEVQALLARASVETLITGLYWLHSEDEEAIRAQGDTARAFRRLMAPFTDEEVIPEVLIETVAGTLGPDTGPPSLLDMARSVSDASGRRGAEDLYERFYRPLSILVAHPSGMALLRHIKGDRIARRPSRVWSVRAARHTADACMAYLAIEIAEKQGVDPAPLGDYFEAHIKRATPPMATVFGLAGLRLLQPRRIRQVAAPTLELWRYYRSGRAARDPHAVRSAKTALAFEAMFDGFGVSLSSGVGTLIDHFVERLAGPGEQTPEVTTPGRTPPRDPGST